MGVGYASWTQGFEATTTVDTGELRVNLMTDWKGVDNTRLPDAWFSIASEGLAVKQPAQDKFIAQVAAFDVSDGSLAAARLYDYKWILLDNEYVTEHNKKQPFTDKVYIDQEMTLIDEDTLHIELFDMYPGATIVNNVYFRNDGTVPVKLSTIPEMNNNIAVAISRNKKVQELLDSGKLSVEVYYEGKNGNMKTGTKSEQDIILPGDVFRIVVVAVLDSDTEEVFEGLTGDLEMENAGFEFEFKLKFDQATDIDA